MKLCKGRYRLSMRRRCLTRKEVGCWNRLPRALVITSTVGVQVVFGQCSQTTVWVLVILWGARRWAQSLWISSNSGFSMIWSERTVIYLQDSYFETNLLKICKSVVDTCHYELRMPLGAAAVLKLLFSNVFWGHLNMFLLHTWTIYKAIFLDDDFEDNSTFEEQNNILTYLICCAYWTIRNLIILY